MNKKLLETAIRKSGGGDLALAEADDLLRRLDLLDGTGRYQGLLSNIEKANDNNNFLAFVLEANFAWQFESKGLKLRYEVSQGIDGSLIDFLRKTDTGDKVYYEMRLLQQEEKVAKEMNAQLKEGNTYDAMLNGDDESKAVVRLMSTILSKVQDSGGAPTKFFVVHEGAFNIVAIDVSALLLQTVDFFDCLLALHGDQAVPEHCRRNIFGLFQGAGQEDPTHIHERAAKYNHIRSTLHGVLFLFKSRNDGLLTYELQQHLVRNPNLLSLQKANAVRDDLVKAVPVRTRDVGS